jgi:hypothetical protein
MQCLEKNPPPPPVAQGRVHLNLKIFRVYNQSKFFPHPPSQLTRPLAIRCLTVIFFNFISSAFSKIIKRFFGVSSLKTSYYCGRPHDLRQLVTAFVQRTEPDMNRFACSEALDCMEAYYKVDSPFYPAPTSIISLANPIV